MTHNPELAGIVPTFQLHDRLQKALSASGVSVTAMSQVLGVTRYTIGNYIHGRTHPKRMTLVAWSHVTGVDLGWLEYGEAAQTPRDLPGGRRSGRVTRAG